MPLVGVTVSVTNRWEKLAKNVNMGEAVSKILEIP